MTVVVDRTLSGELAPPLPDEIFVTGCRDQYQVSTKRPAAPAARLHFPGGAPALFHGEPLMVVWGTHGGADLTRRMEAMAVSARKTTGPYWAEVSSVTPTKWNGNDQRHALYGQLPGKPDTEITQEDMEHHNLILIGTPAQNSVVAALEDRLPVRIKDGIVRSDDGCTWDLRNRALGLLYHNPQAPSRLIYWVASENPEFYQHSTRLLQLQDFFSAPDFMLTGVNEPSTAAARCFDSRWNWEAGYTTSPLIAPAACRPEGFAIMVGQAMRKETGADFCLVAQDWDTTIPPLAPREARLMDLIALRANHRLVVMDMTGRKIEEIGKLLAKAGDEMRKDNGAGREGPGIPRFIPPPRPDQLDPDRVYRVTGRAGESWDYAIVTHDVPANLRLLESTVGDALRHHPPPSH
jgi:hypothetical protein